MTESILTMTPLAKKASGSHYTPKILADFVSGQIVGALELPGRSRTLRLLDPASGDGALLYALTAKLKSIGIGKLSITGFDTNQSALTDANRLFDQDFPDVETLFRHTDFLEWASGGLSLPEIKMSEKFDLVIANPPYVRTQVLGANKAQGLSEKFGLRGRVDLYYGFLKVISDVLSPDGIVGIIVSNRFMTTRSGEAIREELRARYDIIHIWDLGDTQLFEAAVLPAVLLLRGKGRSQNTTQFTSIYSSAGTESPLLVPDAIAAVSCEGLVQTPDGRKFDVKQGILGDNDDSGSVWTVQTAKSDKWLEIVRSRTARTFEEIGKVRVGVKTTADNVFLRNDWTSPRPELLRPVITHHIAHRWSAERSASNWQILYPHCSSEGRRKPIDIDFYPATKAYLERHRRQLEGRKYVIEAGRRWYEIWVPQDPLAWARPKMVFRDISESPCFWIDTSGSIVNGDCYWLTLKEGIDPDWLWLALAVGNSSFIETFYDHRFNNKLYSNRRRFMAQYVSSFPLPDLDLALSKEIVKLSKQIFIALEKTPAKDVEEHEGRVNDLVWQAFGLEEIAG